MKKWMLLLCALLLILPQGALAADGPPPSGYADVSETDWFYAAVTRLSGEGVIHGFDDGCFYPAQPLTQAQLLKLMLAGEDIAPGQGRDWWRPYYEAALAAGLVTPDDEAYLDEPVNRYQAALLLSRLPLLPQDGTLSVQVDWEALLPTIADLEDIPYDCMEAVSAVYAAGLLSGYDDGCFHGDRILSRAEGAQLILRLRDESQRSPHYSTTATDQWFQDALILGNSLAGGLAQSQALTTPDYLYCNGGSVFTYGELRYEDQNGLKWLLKKRLPLQPYAKIILIYGTNEMGVDGDYLRDHLNAFLDMVAAAQPEARLWLCNAPPLNEGLGGTEQLTAENCRKVNALLAEVAAERDIPVIDVWSYFADETGALPADRTWDGVHLKYDGYVDWLDFLKTAVEAP